MDLPLNVDFSGKVVVITGAGGVLCSMMAKAYAQAGAKVAALDLNEEALQKLEGEIPEGQTLKGYKANVLERESLEEVHRAVLRDLGTCDILINGAGGNNKRATTDNEYQHEAKAGQTTFFDLDQDGVDFVFKLNFQGTLLPTLCQGHGGKEGGLHSEYFLHECLYAPYEDPRLFCGQGRYFKLHPVAGYPLRWKRYPGQCHCSRLFGFEPEPQPSLQ